MGVVKLGLEIGYLQYFEGVPMNWNENETVLRLKWKLRDETENIRENTTENPCKTFVENDMGIVSAEKMLVDSLKLKWCWEIETQRVEQMEHSVGINLQWKSCMTY